MKPRDVQKAVKPQRYERSAGDAPSLGRVARVPGTGMPKPSGRRRRRRGEGWSDRRGKSESDARRRVILVWSSMLAIVAFAAVAVFFVRWTFGQMKRENAAGKELAAPVQKIVKSEFPSPTEEVALNHVKAAMALRDPARVATYFHIEPFKPEQVIEFLVNFLEFDGAIKGYQWLSSMDANGLLIEGVLVNSVLSDKPRSRLVLLTPDDSGQWKIDFPAFSRAVSPPWSELLADDATAVEGMIRVVVAPDSYYNGPFLDEKDWVCYGMLSPDVDVEKTMLGYCRRGTPQALAMEEMFLKAAHLGGSRLIRASLHVRRVEGAEARQFEITRVLAEDWIVRETASDGQPP